MRSWLGLVLLVCALAAHAQAPSPQAIEIPAWFSETLLEFPEEVRDAAGTWAGALRVAYTPTIVFFDGGKKVFRVEAYLHPFHLASALEYVASGGSVELWK